MVLYDEHSDVVQWGVNLLEGDHGYCPGYYGDAIQYVTNDVYNGHCFHSHYDTERNQVENGYSHYDAERNQIENAHNHYDTERNEIENDEIIARTLQEEFQRLEVVERSSNSPAEEEQFHSSVPAYDCWNNTSMVNYYSAGHDYGHRGVYDSEPSCSSCNSYETGEYLWEQAENYPLDDEIGRRLNQMVPIPHVPKINGEIPSIDEATSDHQRLLDRLRLYDFVEHQVQGDGNCQFRALSDQLYNTPDQHEFVRQQVVNQLKSHPETYKGYVPMEFGNYLEKMSRSGEWGDHVTLQAAADSYGVRIFVLTSFKDTSCIEILPHLEKPKGVIFLSFWAEVHYNSIYPQGGIPSNESRRKKRWWNFGTRH